MTTNGKWLFSKPFEEQVAWMNAEHQDGTLDGYTAALEAKIAKRTAELERQLEEHREGWNHAIDGWQKAGKRVDELLTHMEKLTAERDEWKSRCEIGKAQFDAILAERELYREALSQLLDTITDGMSKVSAILDNYDEGMA